MAKASATPDNGAGGPGAGHLQDSFIGLPLQKNLSKGSKRVSLDFEPHLFDTERRHNPSVTPQCPKTTYTRLSTVTCFPVQYKPHTQVPLPLAVGFPTGFSFRV